MAASDTDRIINRLPRVLWLVTAQAGDQRSGLIATFVMNASIVGDRPRMVAGLAKHHRTAQLAAQSGALALHLFSAEHVDWVWRFGLQSGHTADKFAGLEIKPGATGSPLVAGATAWLEGRVETHFDTGDRMLFLLEIIDAQQISDELPLTAERMIQLATAAQRQELDAQRQHDAATDLLAIDAWRRAKA